MQKTTFAPVWAVAVVEMSASLDVPVLATFVVASVGDVSPAETVFSRYLLLDLGSVGGCLYAVMS